MIGSKQDLASVEDLEDFSDDVTHTDSESDEETLSKNTDSITLKDIDLDSDNESIDNFEFLGNGVSELNLNSVKEKAVEYKKIAMTHFEPSEEAIFEAKKAISKHSNPVECPICGNYFKYEKGVKLHKAKKH